MTRAEHADIVISGTPEVFKESKRSPEEIIADLPSPVLALAMQRTATPLASDYERWNSFIYEQQQKFAHRPEIFGQFTFTDTQSRPFSRDVSRFLRDLKNAGALTETYSLGYKSDLGAWEMTEEGRHRVEVQHGFTWRQYAQETEEISQALVDTLGVKPQTNGPAEAR